jgi:radical SAM protein with 4Fe4S-binding SPASM domain
MMKRFKRVYIEITNVCNLNCEFCPKTKRKSEFMSGESFEHILKEVKPYTDYIYYHILGEPLLHPDLGKLLALSADYNFKVNITTNGTLIRKQRDILIRSSALRQVNFSLHSFDANEKIYTLESYVGSILDFVEAAGKQSGIICALRLWNLEENNHPFESGISEKESEKNDDILKLLQERLKVDFDIKDRLKDSSRLKLGNNIYLNAASRFQWPDTSLDFSDNRGFCHGLRDQIGILADGTVVPCCLDGEGAVNLGNVLITPFAEILSNKRTRDIYDGFSRREVVEELCKRCDYRRRFGK